MSNTVRVKKDKGYFVASNIPFNDKDLSWDARGLMGYLLSKPDDWTVSVNNLVNMGNAGLYKVRGMLKELEEHGYLKRKRLQDSNGKYYWESTVHEKPTIVQLPIDGSTADGSPIDGKPIDIPSTDLPNTESPKTESKSTKESLNTYCVFLTSWKEKFPTKTQPQDKTTKLKKAWETRIKDKDFQDGWKEALHNASLSPYLQDKSWFQAEYFLRNDLNWQKVKNWEFDWADEQKFGYKGSDKAKEASSEIDVDSMTEQEREEYEAWRQDIIRQREERKK